MFQAQGLSKYDEMRMRKQKKKSKKANVLNSDQIPGHQFKDLDSVLQVLSDISFLM